MVSVRMAAVEIPGEVRVYDNSFRFRYAYGCWVYRQAVLY